jgi:hypothetical protein
MDIIWVHFYISFLIQFFELRGHTVFYGTDLYSW